MGCRSPANSGDARRPEVQFRTADEPASEEASWILERVPGATWDSGLSDATHALAAAAVDRGSRLTPRATADALGEAGYPGAARFMRVLNGGAWPEGMVEELALDALQRAQPVDVALSRRTYGDGATLWIAGMAHRPLTMDPLPRDVPLDEPLPVRVDRTESSDGDTLTLFVAPPDGPVQIHPLTDGVALWLDVFHVPGVYRLEVVDSSDETSQVALLWNHYVDREPAPPGQLPRADEAVPDPMAATEALYDALARLRLEAGMPPLERFTRFEPLAREHAALMASANVVDHAIPGLTEGVAANARVRFHPKAMHYEDAAAAASWREAMDLVALSPGHLQNLLCQPCTHVAIGAALEPVTEGRPPRLFVVWELLEFPNGEPYPVERYDR
jgi:uncharacterized protein YkwD